MFKLAFKIKRIFFKADSEKYPSLNENLKVEVLWSENFKNFALP